jgi:hypothetical protein
MRHRFAAGCGGPIIVGNVKILPNKANQRFTLRGLCGERKGGIPERASFTPYRITSQCDCVAASDLTLMLAITSGSVKSAQVL